LQALRPSCIYESNPYSSLPNNNRLAAMQNRVSFALVFMYRFSLDSHSGTQTQSERLATGGRIVRIMMSVGSPFDGLDRNRLVHPPDTIASFVRLIVARRHYKGEEKRIRARHSLALPIIVQPMETDLRAAGSAFRALTRDLSTEGIGFVHTTPIKSPFVAVEIEMPGDADHPKMQVLVEILRCQTIHERLFHIGGKFVLRFEAEDN
jgi:hypothetical protein